MRIVLLAILGLPLAAPGAAAATPSIADAPIRTVDAGQGQIGYRVVGKGRPLVLIMGLSGTMDAWPPSFVDALARRHRVITFDNAGIRRTTLGEGALTISRMADATASLMRALHLRRTDVLGQAFLRDISAYPALMPQAPLEVSRLQFGASATWLVGNDPSGKNPRRLRLPVLIGGGALDQALPVANQRHLARMLPHTRLKIYRDAAHMFFFQHRRDFLRRVERFLQTAGTKRTRRSPA